METANDKFRFSSADGVAAAVFLLAVGVRIWGAWAGRNLDVADASVVGLMARHMAALKEFPVFFYGQAYMGSLEPLASAILLRILGVSGFAVALGPVVFATAALIFLWRWARDAAGPGGGLAALLAGLIGPAVYFHFQISPRGGYMVALCVDALALGAAGRLAACLREGAHAAWGRYFALGFLAGLGMWSNMIVAPALIVAVLLLAHGMHGKLWRHAGGIAAGLAGFLAGFSPWLVYNIRHGWVSLDMSQISGREPAWAVLSSLWDRFRMLQSREIGQVNPQVTLVLALAVLVLVAIGLWTVLAQFRHASLRENYARAAAVLFCAIFSFVYATSGFAKTHTARYWVPLVPGLAVLMALACAAPGRRLRRWTAWSLLGALAIAQVFAAVPTVLIFSRSSAAAFAGYRQIGEVLDQAGIDSLLAPIQFFPMNFALDERIAVSDGKQMFYEPILRRVELAEAPAYLSDYKGIGYFLRQLDVTYDSRFAGGRDVIWNLRRPMPALREISPDLVARMRDGAGVDRQTVLMDRNLDTGWSPVLEQKDAMGATLEWTFTATQDLQSVSLVFAHGLGEPPFDFPQRLRIEVKSGGAWRTLRADEIIVPLEWSGRRVYFPAGRARLDYPVQVTGAEALRIGLLETRTLYRQQRWKLAEVTLFAPGAGTPVPMDAAAVDIAGERLREVPLDAVIYAPRWLSNQLLRRNWVAEERLAGLPERIFGSKSVSRDGTVVNDRPAVFVVETAYAAAARAVLGRQSRGCREETVGPWILLMVSARDWDVDGMNLPPAVAWSGDAPLLGNTAVRAGAALQRMQAGTEPVDIQKALLNEVAHWRPAALSALPEEEVARLGGPEMVAIRRSAASIPAKPCVTEFANGIRLEGVEVEPAEVSAGGKVDLRLYWSAGKNFVAAPEYVFIHLRDNQGKIVAQDDYQGVAQPWGHAALRPLPGECMVETRSLMLPADLPSGPLELSIGLYRPESGRRTQVIRTEAPGLRRNAPVWPGFIRVKS